MKEGDEQKEKKDKRDRETGREGRKKEGRSRTEGQGEEGEGGKKEKEDRRGRQRDGEESRKKGGAKIKETRRKGRRGAEKGHREQNEMEGKTKGDMEKETGRWVKWIGTSPPSLATLARSEFNFPYGGVGHKIGAPHMSVLINPPSQREYHTAPPGRPIEGSPLVGGACSAREKVKESNSFRARWGGFCPCRDCPDIEFQRCCRAKVQLPPPFPR